MRLQETLRGHWKAVEKMKNKNLKKKKNYKQKLFHGFTKERILEKKIERKNIEKN